MKTFIILIILSFSVFGETREVTSGAMEYQVSHLIKTVSGKSGEVRGKLECGENECEFLLGAKVSSFVSSDSNRDTNMLTMTEATKFPVVTGSGKFPAVKLREKKSFEHQVEVNFHGVKKTYLAKTEFAAENKLKSRLVVFLDNHGIERPSLFGVKIKNDVPLTLETEWILK